MISNDAKIADILLIDPLAEGHSHLIDDDLYITQCVLPLTDKYLIYSSPYSVNNILKSMKVDAVETLFLKGFLKKINRLRLLIVILKMPCNGFENILFQSFEEISTLVFMLLNPNKRAHLIVTNNLRPDRLKRYPKIGKFFLRETFIRATSIVVHSQHEIERIIELIPDINQSKIFKKPFHQFAFPRVRLNWEDKTRTILFIGPACSHKTVAPIIDLIKYDSLRKFNYIFTSMKNSLHGEQLQFLEKCNNVKIMEGFIESNEYYKLISDASFVILTHDDNYEGTLSGVFCDSIASGTAVIASDMAPHSEFFDNFGPMGILVDFTNVNWAKSFFESNYVANYILFQNNMSKCREYANTNSIRKVFANILSHQ